MENINERLERLEEKERDRLVFNFTLTMSILTFIGGLLVGWAIWGMK